MNNIRLIAVDQHGKMLFEHEFEKEEPITLVPRDTSTNLPVVVDSRVPDNTIVSILMEDFTKHMSKKQVPSVGRVVHYFAYGSPHGEFPAEVARAAVITEVDEPDNPESAVGLCVLNPSGLFLNQHIPHASVQVTQTGRKSGAWDWLPYVPPIEVDDDA